MLTRDLTAGIAFALVPVMIVLFAFEMSIIEDGYNAGALDQDQMGRRVAFAMLKLPAWILAPIILGAAGALLMLAAYIVSALLAVRTYKDTARLRAETK